MNICLSSKRNCSQVFPQTNFLIYTAGFISVACFYNAGGGKVLFYCGNPFHNHQSFGLNLDFHRTLQPVQDQSSNHFHYFDGCKIVTFVFSCQNVFVFFYLTTGTVLLLGLYYMCECKKGFKTFFEQSCIMWYSKLIASL